MGCDKLSLPFGEMCLGNVALQAALQSKLDGVLFVTRSSDPPTWLSPSLLARPFWGKWVHIPCRNAGRGQAYSLRCGIYAAQALQAEAIIVLLADQPLITPEMIDRLIVCYQNSVQEYERIDYVASSFKGMARPPLLFSHRVFPLLLRLRGDEGARRLLRKDSSLKGRTIEYNDASLFCDIDTVEEYNSIVNRYGV